MCDGGQLRKLVLSNLNFFNSTSSTNGTSAGDAHPSRRFDVGAMGMELVAGGVVTLLTSEAVIVERG